MQLYYQTVLPSNVEWKKLALKAYLCWSVCVDTAALIGILWYIFR